MNQDFLYWDDKTQRFFFQSRNPNVQKIYGITKAASAEGYVYVLPGFYPDGYKAVRDFVSIFPKVKASPQAIARIEYFKSIPDKIRNLETVNTLDLPLERKPYMHQLEILEYLMHFPRLAVLAEQGLGKTYIALCYQMMMAQRLGRKFRTLVLAPRIVLRNWYQEALDYTPLKPVLYRGDPDQRAEIRQRLREDDSWDMIVTNYEAITPIAAQEREAKTLNKSEISVGDEIQLEKNGEWFGVVDAQQAGRFREFAISGLENPVHQRHVVKARRKLESGNYLDDFRAFRQELDFSAIIMDEGSRIKGHDSSRSQAIQKIAQRIPYRVLMSGTISLGSPLDVYMPFTILNDSIFGGNYFRFKNRYCEYAPYNKHVITGYRRLDHLKECMDPYIVAKTRDECLGLPDRILNFTYYDMTEEQKDLYNSIVEEQEIVLADRPIDVSMAVVKITKLMQVLSGFFILPAERDDRLCNSCIHLAECMERDVYPWNKQCAFHDTEAAKEIKKPKREYYELKRNPKLEMLEDFLTEDEDKVIIWAYYQKELQDIRTLLDRRKIRYITAGEEDCDSKYESDPTLRVFLGQVSQGIGITLNSAKKTYYYSQSLKLDDRLQSLDRNYRIGQTEKVFVWDSICPGSIEESVTALLRNKEDVKDFIQRRNECTDCEKMIHCLERGIRPYSEKCALYEDRCRAEEKTRLKLKQVS